MTPSAQQSVRQVHRPVTVFGLQPGRAVADIFQGLAMWRIWITLSWQEFVSTYRRSLLGILWIIFSFAGFVAVKLIVFSSLLDTDDSKYYNAHLIVGYFIWLFISQSINAAPDTFVSAQGWIRSEPLPYSLYIYKAINREIYNFALTSVVVIAALVYIGRPVSLNALYSIPAILFLMLNAFSIKLLMGVISARFRDFSHLVKAVMVSMLFLTPVFWMPSQMPGLVKYLWWNPLYHYLAIFREPILDGTLPVTSWIFVGVVYGIITLLALVLFARFRQRIIFWF